jgi:hypothetical protein
MNLENPRKKSKERTKKKICTTYFQCQAIFTKTGETCHGVFFKQCLEFDIVFLETFDVTNMIKLHKGGNTKPRVMKKL